MKRPDRAGRRIKIGSWPLGTSGSIKTHNGAPSGSSDSSDYAKTGENRRVFPRVEMKLGAYLVGENGESGKADLLNLSRGGVALSINEENGLRVFPEGQIRPGKAVGVRFDLAPAGKEPDVIQAIGRVVWSQRVDEDVFVMGIEFTAFHADSARRVDRYLLECMRID